MYVFVVRFMVNIKGIFKRKTRLRVNSEWRHPGMIWLQRYNYPNEILLVFYSFSVSFLNINHKS